MKSVNQLVHRVIGFFKHSFHRKLILSFFIIIALTVVVLSINFYGETAKEMKTQAITNMERLSQQSASTLESYMSNFKALAWDYFSDTNFQKFVMNMGIEPNTYSYYLSKLNQFVTENPMVQHIMVEQLEGYRIVAGYRKENSFNLQEEERLYQIAMKNDGKGEWVTCKVYDAAANQFHNTLVFVQALKEVKIMSRPIIGVFILQFDPEYVQSWLRSANGAGEGNFHIIDRADGKVLLANDSNSLGSVFVNESDLNTINQIRYSKLSSGHLFTKGEKGSQLLVYQSLKDTQWAIAAKVPVHVLLSKAKDAATRAIWLGLLVFLLSITLASLLSSRVTTPLRRLMRGMKAIERGNYNIKVPVQTEDEIGYFCDQFNKMTAEMNRLIVKVYETELHKKDAEIKALQSQMNPHFLFNTLGTIDSLASAYEDDRISQISQSLAKMCRYNLNENHTASLMDEIRQIELYLSLQKIRYGDRLHYSIEIESGLESVIIPKLLIQPLVENSIIHGIDLEVMGGEILVEAFSINERDLIIRVWNNGATIDVYKQQKLGELLEKEEIRGTHLRTGISIGTVNVHNRIRLLYGDQYGLSFSSSVEDGTVFWITLRNQLSEDGVTDESSDLRG